MTERSPRTDPREDPPRPRVDHLIVEDGEPVDSVFAEMQMRLLVSSLRGGWRPGRPFVAMANVGLFVAAKNPAIVPDVLVSLDVESADLGDLSSYFVWELGKVPDIVFEIVSNTPGGELSDKLRAYERMRIPHYVVFDPLHRLSEQELTIFMLHGGAYRERRDARFEAEGLALVRWEGEFEGNRKRWLRWTDLDGNLLRTVEEAELRADALAARADAEKARADSAESRAAAEETRADFAESRAAAEKTRADSAESRADALAERLRALGIDPGG